VDAPGEVSGITVDRSARGSPKLIESLRSAPGD
jgi:hypothetical protein